ncbi:unnamed protein product, partial [Callosobruchus maculatus]
MILQKGLVLFLATCLLSVCAKDAAEDTKKAAEPKEDNKAAESTDKKQEKRGLFDLGYGGGFEHHDLGGHDFGGHDFGGGHHIEESHVKAITITKEVK